MQLGAIVLAGGRSRRMGRPKESLVFAGDTLLGRTVDTVLQAAWPVVVAARDEEQELPPLPPEIDVVFDPITGEGPLVGMLAGLRAIADECDAAFVSTCDMPFLSVEAVGWLASRMREQDDLVVPRLGGKLQPLAAVYATRVLPVVEKLVAEGERRAHMVAQRVRTRVLEQQEIESFDPDLRVLQGINSPEEYEAARRAAGG